MFSLAAVLDFIVSIVVYADLTRRVTWVLDLVCFGRLVCWVALV